MMDTAQATAEPEQATTETTEGPVSTPAWCPPQGRRVRSDGLRSREAILRKAATAWRRADGIEGLSLSRIANAVGMSKSGIYAHFGSKKELQLSRRSRWLVRSSTISVVVPAAEAKPGLERLNA